MSKREYRYISDPIQIDSSGDTKKITGYAAKFAPCRSLDLGGFTEEIHPNAFDKCLKSNPDIRALWNHDTNCVLGRTKSGTLSLSVDETGLKYSITPPQTQVAKDLMITMERGDVDQASFGFVCVKDSWREERDGSYVRTLLEVDCFDVSPTTYGAYTDASAQLRSLFPDEKQLPERIQSKIEELRNNPRGERRFRKVLSAVGSTVWAIEPTKLEAICCLLNARSEGISATKEEIRAVLQSAHGEAPQANGVAVIPVYGTISQRATMFDDVCDATSCEALTAQFRSALADGSVGTIVFDIDSPGGTVTGVPELAAEIMAARGKKPIIAVANGMAASAAYFIASAADQIVVMPSGSVGSIGVYRTHEDVSQMLDKEGVKITFIKAGAHKAEGNPYEPLSQDAEDYMQKQVNVFYDMFTKAVAAGRGVSQEEVIEKFGQGRMVLAEEAVSLGMADKVATLDQVLASLVAVEATPTEMPITGNETETTVASTVVDDGDCQCSCQPCMDGNCADCEMDDCDDPNCGCSPDGDPDVDDPDPDGDGLSAWRDDFALQLKYRQLRAKM